jgi:glycosyltransferase involved in cell wall biosynthesis
MFRDYQPRERLAESLSVADVHLVSLRPELEGLIVPSKLYGVLAAGRPCLFIGAADGDIARVLARHDLGRTIAPGDGMALAAAVEELANDPGGSDRRGQKARAVFDAEYDKPTAVARWEDLIRTLGVKQ